MAIRPTQAYPRCALTRSMTSPDTCCSSSAKPPSTRITSVAGACSCSALPRGGQRRHSGCDMAASLSPTISSQKSTTLDSPKPCRARTGSIAAPTRSASERDQDAVLREGLFGMASYTPGAQRLKSALALAVEAFEGSLLRLWEKG